MTTCPACGADSETCYRCSECGRDLVDVDDNDDGSAAPPLRTDGGEYEEYDHSGGNMERVTLRVPSGLLNQVDALHEDGGHYPNRSEAVRDALRKLVREYDLDESGPDNPHTGSDERSFLRTDGGQELTLEDAAEPALVGTCAECDGQLIEETLLTDGETGRVTLVCRECNETVEVDYEIGAEQPWKQAAAADGVADADVKPVAWVDCERCDGHGRIEDPLCDLRRAMNGREHTCPSCDGTGSVPRVVAPDGGRRVGPSATGRHPDPDRFERDAVRRFERDCRADQDPSGPCPHVEPGEALPCLDCLLEAGGRDG